MSSRLICVRCPKGCLIEVTVEDGEVRDVKGYGCLVGLDYARKEAFSPRRYVCTTVRIVGGRHPRLPVRTSGPVPREKIREVVEALRGLVVEAPVKKGDVIAKDVAGTGADIIAEITVEREEGWGIS